MPAATCVGPGRRVAAALACCVLYGTLAVWMTWPLGARLGTHLPVTHDIAPFEVPLVAWTLSWESHALVTDPLRLPEANIYHPAPHALFYAPTAFGALPYFMPTFLLTGNPALALNLMFLGCIALTACALHLVVRRWGGSQLAGFVAAWTFLTARWVFWDGLAPEPNYAVLQYFPVIILVAARPPLAREGSACLLALLVLQGATNLLYVAPAVFIPLALLSLGRLLRRATRAGAVRHLALIGLAALVLLVLHAGHLIVRAENPLLRAQTIWPHAPHMLMLLPGGALTTGPTAVARAALLMIVAGATLFTLRALAGTVAEERRPWLHAAFWTVVGLLISMTPITLWYAKPIALPHVRLAYSAGVYQAVREPLRLGIASLMGLSLLAGLAFTECTRWARRWPRVAPLAEAALGWLVVAAIYGQYAHGFCLTLPLYPSKPCVEAPPAYPVEPAISPASPLVRLLREGAGPVLELPALTPNVSGNFPTATAHAQAMYRSIFHWRPILNGYAGYWPEGFPERMTLASRLPDTEALAVLRRETGLATILVHVNDFAGWGHAAKRTAWLALAERGQSADGLRLVARDGGDLLFAVTGG